MTPDINIQDVKDKYKNDLLQRDGVQSVGVDHANGHIVVGVAGITRVEAARSLPSELEGIPVDVKEFGDISPETPTSIQPGVDADTGLADRTQSIDPIPGGVSIGHHQITAGTSGFVLTNGTDRYLASNNHVLANSNAGTHGDPIYQPGPIHDGEHVGDLEDYTPLQNGATVDLAWAKIGERTGITNDILGVGGPYGDIHDPTVGDTLVSSGITSGVSSAAVQSANTSVKVRFDEDTTYILEDQVITESMSGPGDSGSPVLHEGHPAGMIFAGSEQVSVLMTASNITQASGLSIETKNPPTVAMEDAMWTFRARPDPDSPYEQGVYDGDTWHLLIDQGFRSQTAQPVRSRRLDTAELRGDEYEAGIEQRDFVREWVREAIESYSGSWPLLIRTYQEEGKYGRWLGDVYNRDEESLFGAVVEEFGEDVVYEGFDLEEMRQRFNELAE